MNLWGYLILLEVLPVSLWVAGAFFENKAKKFPNTMVGYRSKFAIKNKFTWEYANKVFAKVAGSIGTFLFVMNAIIVFNFGISSSWFVMISNIIGIILVIFIVEKTLLKKFNKDGEFKNN